MSFRGFCVPANFSLQHPKSQHVAGDFFDATVPYGHEKQELVSRSTLNANNTRLAVATPRDPIAKHCILLERVLYSS